jgi:hypothetical protein
MLSDMPEILRNSFGIGGFVGIHCCGSCHFSRRTHLQALLEAQEFIHGRCTPMYRCSAASEMMYRHTHTVLSDLSVYIVIVCTIYAAYIIVFIYIYIILYHQYIIYHIISIHIYLWHCRWWLITRGNSIFRIVIIQKSMLVYVDFMNMQDM